MGCKKLDMADQLNWTEVTFHAKMGTIKDRNGMDLTEAEEIKKRWQKYTELTLMTRIITMVYHSLRARYPGV